MEGAGQEKTSDEEGFVRIAKTFSWFLYARAVIDDSPVLAESRNHCRP